MVLRALFLNILLILIVGCASTTPKDYTLHHTSTLATELSHVELPVHITNPQGIEFRGVASEDDRVNGSGVMYAADGGVGGVAVQIAAHAAAVKATQERKLVKLREKADKALDPLVAELDGLVLEDLLSTSIPGAFSVQVGAEDSKEYEVAIESYPIFYVSDDLATVSIKNVVSLKQARDGQTATLYQNLVEVISANDSSGDPLTALKDDGLTDTVRALFRQSVQIALTDMRGILGPTGTTQESIRIHHGDGVRIERGVVLHQTCDMELVRNLRGWLIGHPKKAEEDSCTDGLALSPDSNT